MRLLLIALLASAPVAAAPDSNTPLHVGVSMALVTGLYFTMSGFTGRDVNTRRPALLGAASFSLALGFAKETVDAMERRDKRIDMEDMAANALGVGIATGLIYFLDIHNVRPHPNGIAMEF